MHPSAAMASLTKTRPRHACLTGTITGRTGFAAGIGNSLSATGGSFFQTDCQIKSNIGGLGDTFRGFRRHIAFRVSFDIGLIGEIYRQQQIVSGADLLEAFGSVGIGIPVRVPAHGEPSIGALYIGQSSLWRNTKNCMGIHHHADKSTDPQ